jgi:mercuric ion transport protein
MKHESNYLITGVLGAVISAICCFTPILVISLSAIGLSAVSSYLDAILFPAMAFFITITLVGLWKKTKN